MKRPSLIEWIEGADVAEGDQDWLRGEFRLLAESIHVVQQSLGKLSQDLDQFSTEQGEHWSGDPWVHGYRCGKARQAQTFNVIASLLANNLYVRATQPAANDQEPEGE